MTLIFQKIKFILRLHEENRALKAEIKELQETIARLETRLCNLQKATSFFGRGLPWRS